MGYKSYVFYKMLKIDKSKVQAFENVLSSMPEESNIKKFNIEKDYSIVKNFDSVLLNKFKNND